MLGLRKINKDGWHYNFQWPLEVGAKAVAPDWNTEVECGGGLHLFPEGTGDLGLLDGHYWAVVEYDETKAVDLGGKIKVPECTIVHISESPHGLLEYFPKMKNPTSEQAYYWAKYIGDVEYMRLFVTASRSAYLWAISIGDLEHMRQFVTNSEDAYLWAKFLGDVEYMRQFVTESEYAYRWATYIGDVEYMRQFVTESSNAYLWAKFLGDVEYMRQFINKSYHAYLWARDIGDREYMRQFVTESYHAYYWAKYIGDVDYMLEIARGSEYENLIKGLINARTS